MLYRTLRGFWRIALAVFFSDIEVEGRERVPGEGPLLIVPNHTNALVDPLVILVQLRRAVTITAKTTLAENPLLALLMRGLNVVTFQRRQDVGGAGGAIHNLRAFDECRRRLRNGAAICIFPEGMSHSDPSLRPFKSGAARIALDYVERESDRGELRLVPVGLYFEKKDRFRSSVWVRFGEPFGVAKWLSGRPAAKHSKETRTEAADVGEPAEAGPGRGAERTVAAELTAEIEDRVRALTLNFETMADVELYTWAAEVVGTGGQEPAALGREAEARLGQRVRWIKRLQAGYQELRDRRAETITDLENRLRRYQEELQRLGITPAEVYLPMAAGRAAFFVLREMELLVIGLPVALWGMVNHLAPYHLTRLIARKMSRDEDHFASNAVFIALPVFPLLYIVQIVTAAWLLPIWLAAVYAVSLPYAGAVALYYRDRVGSIRQRTAVFLRFVVKPDLQRQLAEEGRAIIGAVERLGRELG